MQWPPTSPGSKPRKFHLVRAASSTSQTDTPIFEKIFATSLMKAMLMSRCAFSIALAASGRLDRGGAEHAAAGHRAIDPRELLDHLLILAGDRPW